MTSMTGYGYAVSKTDAYVLEVEIKSYNNRYLDISHNIAYALSGLESAMDAMIKEKIGRGHLDLSVRFRLLESNPEVTVDEGALRSYMEAFSKVEAIAGVKPSFSDYIQAEGVIAMQKENDAELYRKAALDTLSKALDALLVERRREGEATKADLVEKGRMFLSSLENIKSSADGMTVYFRNLLETRFKELMQDKGLDEPRFMEEVTLLLVKYSINEEIKRLESHMDEYFKLLESEEGVGKRLDFLCQEMNRECNTIGSKSQMVEITREVVNMKDSLENIREQIRNIE